ncbi:MAG: DUF2202 domain-containing protein [Prolixibacteraceae bacterium]|jgi:hypothetical protein|nr:DUF2202 domain-containing protein [Prolixibacteraceae bacterium]
MKTTFVFTAVIFAVAFTSCSDDVLDETISFAAEKSLTIDGECADSSFTSTVDDLSDVDIAGLSFMREEELLAHDVYVYFFEKYGTTVFSRIANSESKHAESVLALLTYFGMEDPTTGIAGSYNNAELQSLYNELTVAGDESVEAALAVGALIEETDIIDLQGLIEETTNIDIEMVYENLLYGSFNHLKAFTNSLSALAVEYSPQLLPVEQYEEILATVSAGNGNNQYQNGGNGQQRGEGSKGQGNGHRGDQSQKQQNGGDGVCNTTEG